MKTNGNGGDIPASRLVTFEKLAEIYDVGGQGGLVR
jgi:hypothetical protein